MEKLLNFSADEAATPLAHSPGLNKFGPHVIIAALRHYPWLLAGLVLGSLVVAAAVWLFLPKQQKSAYVLFHVQSSQPHILRSTSHDGGDAFDMYRRSQAALLKSRLVMNSALQNPAVRNSSVLRGVPEEAKAATLEQLVRVDLSSGGPEMMRLQLEGENEEELRTIVNAIAQAYLSDIVNKKRNAQAQRRERLLALQKSLQTQVEHTAKLLSNQRDAQDSLNPLETKLLLHERRTNLLRQKLEEEKQLRDLQIELQLLNDPRRPHQPLDAVALAALRDRLLANTEYRTTRERRDHKKADLDETRRRLAPGKVTPELLALEADWKKLDAACTAAEVEARKTAEATAAQAETQTATANRVKLESGVKFHQQILQRVNDELKEMAPESATNGDLYDVQRLQIKMARDRDLLSKTETELTNIQLEADAPERVTKIDADIMHVSEIKRRAKFSALAAAGFLFLGLGGLIWREIKNPRVLDSRQLPNELGLPLIGVLPALRPQRALLGGGETADNPSWQLALGEAVNTARAILQHGVTNGQPARTIMIGSALSGEGKTSLALLLANSLAQAGHQTLLIDGDLRRPNLHTYLRLPNQPGLCEYLAGEVGEQDILQPTETPGLSVILGGQWSRKTSQGLATNLWPELLTESAARFDYIIIDSSPFLPVADALLMARRVDGVLLSVMREVSEIAPVKDALAQLALVGARVLGVVMNRGHAPSYYRSLYYGPNEVRATTELTAE